MLKTLRDWCQRHVMVTAVVGGVLLWDTSALAFNAIVSQDLPILIEMAATEMASYLQLTAVLVEASAIVAQVKEYTSVVKTAYRGLEELVTLSDEDVRAGVMQGLNNALPEVAEIRGNMRDIGDLRYSDPRAVAVIRGMLWEDVYGPSLEAIRRNTEKNLENGATIRERKVAYEALLLGRSKEWRAWDKSCRDEGAGACQLAAAIATIEHSHLLGDIHETLLWGLELQSREQLRADRHEVQEGQELLEWMSSVEAYIATQTGARDKCTPGSCLFERYAGAPARIQAEYRRNKEPIHRLRDDQ